MTTPTSTDHDDLPALAGTLDFLASIWELNHALEATSSRLKTTIGITAQQRMIIRIVGKFPGISAGQLAALLRVHPGTLSTALLRLSRRGLVVRERDARDKRRVVLGLSARGRAFDVPLTNSVEGAVARMLATVSPEGVTAARRCMRALVGALQADGNASRVPSE